MSILEPNANVILVGQNARSGVGTQGVPYELQLGRFLIRFEEALTVDGAIEQAAEVFGLEVDDATPVPEMSGEWIESEPNVHHRWLVHLADDADPATRENFEVDTESETQFVRPIYRASGDPDKDVYPIFSSLVVSADDHIQVDEELMALGYQALPAWASLFAELGARPPENDHPLLRFSRETSEPLYRYYQLPSGKRTLDTEFFEHIAGVASRSDISSIDFDWAKVQPYREGQTDRSSRQENLTLIHAREAWAEIPGEAEVRIAVLDSGFDLNHADLVGTFLPLVDHFNAKQFLDGIAHPLLAGNGGAYDASFTSDSHGTAVAGVIGAIQGNNEGIDGVAQGCKLMPVRLGIEPSSFKCVAGLAWAAFRGARVVNMSFELVEPLPVTSDMIEAADALGLVMVAASGNDGKARDDPTNPRVSFPASHPKVLAVGAVDGNKRRVVPSDGVRWGSQFRGGVDVVAPGTDVLTTDVTGSAGVYPGDYIDPGGGGTSAATPHVAALAGMILAVQPDLSAAAVRSIIRETATRLDDHPQGSDGRNEEVGHGLINCFEAVKRAKEKVPMAVEKRGDLGVSDWAAANDFGFLPDYLKDVLSGRAGFETITSDARNLRPLVCITGTALVPRGQVPSSMTEGERHRRNREKAEVEAAGDVWPVDTWYRLYLNNDLSEWVDFDHDALRHVRAWGFDSSPLGRVSVWLDAGARLGHSVSTSAGGFLSGQLLRQAQTAAQTDGATQLNSTLEQILSAVSRDGTYSSFARPC